MASPHTAVADASRMQRKSTQGAAPPRRLAKSAPRVLHLLRRPNPSAKKQDAPVEVSARASGEPLNGQMTRNIGCRVGLAIAREGCLQPSPNPTNTPQKKALHPANCESPASRVDIKSSNAGTVLSPNHCFGKHGTTRNHVGSGRSERWILTSRKRSGLSER